MKKVFFVVVASLMMATTNLEAGVKSEKNNDVDFNIDINMNSLTRYLNLKYNQMEGMEEANRQLYYGVKFAKSSNPIKQSVKLNNAVKNNLRNVHKVLTPKQYRDYLNMLNTTFINKGLDKVFYYQDLAEK